jgi:23S rRNA (adenine2503-C2)-methyltransferase
VTRALSIIEHPWGAGMSPRRITVSTSGVVTGIDLLAKVRPLPNLAISLNATTDEVRSQIMPVNRRWNIETLACRRSPLSARPSPPYHLRIRTLCRGQRQRHGRRPYSAAAWQHPKQGQLDSLESRSRLALPAPKRARILAFQNLVRRPDLPVYIRTPRGDDTAAACGQLAARTSEANRLLASSSSKVTRHVS